MKQKYFLFVFFLLLVFSFNCANEKKTYTILTASKSGTYYSVGKILAKLFTKHTNKKFIVISGDGSGSKSNRKWMIDKKADFALMQSDTPTHEDLRTITPLYPEILHVSYKSELQAKNITDLFKNKKVSMGPSKSGTYAFAKKVLSSFGINDSMYTTVDVPSYKENRLSDKIDISIHLTGLANENIKYNLLEMNGKLLSLDDMKFANGGSRIHGFCLSYPKANAFVIPKNTYQNKPLNPVLTIMVNAILVTHKDADINLIHDITKIIFSYKQSLSAQKSQLNFLNEDFLNYNTNFATHEGAIQYFERNQPGFVERYAEVMGVIFTIVVTFITALSWFIKFAKIRKKNRIDVYYEKILNIDKAIVNLKTPEEKIKTLDTIHELRNKAFTELIAERLLADESFRIFISLMDDVKSHLEKELPNNV